MNLITKYLTKNPCYTSGETIVVKGLFLHSVGCPQPSPEVFIKNWNKSTYTRACVHGFIGDTKTYITLPCLEKAGVAHRAWHCAKGKNGSANNTHLGFEMCEPAYIKYTGGANFVCTNTEKAIAFVEKTTWNAVELFAKLCTYHNLNPLEDGVILSHAEGGLRGVASNHADPDHLWRGLNMNWSMDRFRQEVYKKMHENNIVEEDDDMDINRFKELWFEMRKELQDNDHGTWSEEALSWAIENGLIAGGNKLPNGQANYMLEDILTREQLLTILWRFAQLIGKA